MNELFANTQDALVFAFKYSAQQYPASAMSTLMASGQAGTGKGLVSVAGAGQAGMLQSEIQALNPLHRACIIGRYAVRSEECPCCGGEKLRQEYSAAVDELADWAVQWLTGISIRAMRQGIVRAYYERGV